MNVSPDFLSDQTEADNARHFLAFLSSSAHSQFPVIIIYKYLTLNYALSFFNYLEQPELSTLPRSCGTSKPERFLQGLMVEVNVLSIRIFQIVVYFSGTDWSQDAHRVQFCWYPSLSIHARIQGQKPRFHLPATGWFYSFNCGKSTASGKTHHCLSPKVWEIQSGKCLNPSAPEHLCFPIIFLPVWFRGGMPNRISL